MNSENPQAFTKECGDCASGYCGIHGSRREERRTEQQPFLISDAKIEYYRSHAKSCPGAPSCQGWSCIPLVELIGVINSLRSRIAELERQDEVTDAMVDAGSQAGGEWLRGFEQISIKLSQRDKTIGTDLVRSVLTAALAAKRPTA